MQQTERRICDAHVVMAMIERWLDICPYEQEKYCVAALRAVAVQQIEDESFDRDCADCQNDFAGDVDNEHT